MSLIFCPECKKQISDKSANCPNCGYPINGANAPNIVLKQKEGCFLQTLNLGCLIVCIIGGILLFGSLIFALTNSSKKIKTEKIKTEKTTKK